MKVYRGSPGAARNYVEADRSRADDYYLAEGTGIAQRFAATADGHVVEVPSMDGEAYEAWVAGVDPDTGEPRGRLHTDDRAVRFVEVTVNGPKSWSLAAELHPDIAVAYQAAQDRAAGQIISWLAQHATTRIGPRGGQSAVPVQRLEAAVIRHYTSRAGDPHRHLHLQINARVFAAGSWRGIDTVAVRDSLGAINGIGHAAIATDPQLRAALAAHGYTLTAGGEITQLAPFIGPFSRRAAQIAANIDRYEAEWRTANPGRVPGPGLRRSWDARAWAEARPDKVSPQPGEELHGRWLAELDRLGYRDHDKPVQLFATPAGELNRDQAAVQVITTLGAGRSAWNAADVRGEVEQLLARRGIVVEAAVRAELAEDLTARALARCVPLLDRPGLPAHIRALSSPQVIQVEQDLVGRLAVRGAEPGNNLDPTLVADAAQRTGSRVDQAQATAIAALTGNRALVLIEGAAGAGKTTTLRLTRDLLIGQDHRLMVVTPTLKAAHAATAEVGARAGSAAWLAYQYGWRWDEHGTWTRLHVGELDPVTGHSYAGPRDAPRLEAGDLLVADQAGMLDQDTAHALLTLADEQQVRVALLGDRHQLAAVGRGGVLEHATRWVDPDAYVGLDVVHRFTRQSETAPGVIGTVPDTEYAELSVAMRSGQDPAAVFDALCARGQIRIHATAAEQRAAIATAAAAALTHGQATVVVADTREQVAELNAAIRDHLITAGIVDDQRVITTQTGERIGVGDTIATRRNDRDLDVANRDTWTVTSTHSDGRVRVFHPTAGQRTLPADYVATHVELAYASTVHGAQGDTASTAHLALGEHTGAASAYVAMTRGRKHNTAHLIADSLDEAREQWVAAFAKDRADRGPEAARQDAEREAARYAPARPLDSVLTTLHKEWERQADATETLDWARPRLDAAIWANDKYKELVGPSEERIRAAKDAQAAAQAREQAIERDAYQIAEQLHATWTGEAVYVQSAAQRAAAGTGWLGHGGGEVQAAQARVQRWEDRWAAVLDRLSPRMAQAAPSAAYSSRYEPIGEAIHAHAHARDLASPAHPRQPGEPADTASARTEVSAAYDDYTTAFTQWANTSAPNGARADPGSTDQLQVKIAAAETKLASAQDQIGELQNEPAITQIPNPSGWLADQHASWSAERDQRHHDQRTAERAAWRGADQPKRERDRQQTLTPSHHVHRGGPSHGR